MIIIFRTPWKCVSRKVLYPFVVVTCHVMLPLNAHESRQMFSLVDGLSVFDFNRFCQSWSDYHPYNSI